MSKKNTFEAKDFALRLAMLREARKISACAMSHELGHNRNYINGIELQKYFPSLTEFFEICNYLGISPGDFSALRKRKRPLLEGQRPHSSRRWRCCVMSLPLSRLISSIKCSVYFCADQYSPK